MIKKIRFYKNILIEILETLCTICLFLESDSRYSHNQYGRYMHSHFDVLKRFSNNMRGDTDD